MTSIQLPTGATSERTLAVIKEFEAHVASREALDTNLVVHGFSFSGQAPMRPWPSPCSKTGISVMVPRPPKRQSWHKRPWPTAMKAR